MPANNITWTPAREERLLQLLDKGVSYKECAAVISREFRVSISKNACVGKGRRLQVPLRMPPRKGSICRKRKSLERSRKASGLPRSERRKRAKDSLKRLKLRHSNNRKSRQQNHPRQLTLLQLQPRSCRWPSGNYAPYTFCGCQQAEGSPYCLRHTLIASPSYGRAR